MKRVSVLCSIFLICLCKFNFAYTQYNLVPNPGFEEYNSCPTDISQIGYSVDYTFFPTVKSWTNPLGETSPDYYNVCAPNNSNVKLPHTLLGYQHARTGSACAGIVAAEIVDAILSKGNLIYDTGTVFNNYKEYIECKLLEPLKPGKIYEVSFFVSYSYNTEPNILPVHSVATDMLGASFSNVMVQNDDSLLSLELDYDIVSSTGVYMADTNKWVEISGKYTAQGGEEFLIIGKFLSSEYQGQYKLVHLSALEPIPAIYASYYFIDDVSVTELICDTIINTHDTTICKDNILLESNTDGDQYEWNTGSTSKNLIIDVPGTYWRRTIKGCNLTVDTFFVVSGDEKHCSECSLWLPSAFSPDGNGLNDRLRIISNCELTSLHIKIYNRWGNLVFESNDINNEWDGTFQGRMADLGTYFFFINYSIDYSHARILKGDITLIR